MKQILATLRLAMLLLTIPLLVILLLSMTACGNNAYAYDGFTVPSTGETVETVKIETADETVDDAEIKATDEITEPIAETTKPEEITVPKETEPAKPETTEEPAVYTDVNEIVYATGSVNVRTGPGTKYDKITMLNRGESVTRIGIGSNNWDKVIYNNTEAYISHNYLSTQEPAATPIDTGEYPKTYSDSSCTITIYKEWYENAWCYAAHLEFTDYTRFGMACANGQYNSGGEATSKAGNRLGAILCINGDYATPGNGAGGYAIARGGVVCNDGANYCEAMYNSNNGLLTYRTYDNCSGQQLSTLVAEGKVTDTMQFGPAFLLNGSIQCGTGGGRAQRTFIGTNGNAGDIWIVVSDGRNNDGESAGLTGYQCAAYLQSKGCTFGVPLDGGGSSTIWFQGKVLNAANGRERAVADFVYFK